MSTATKTLIAATVAVTEMDRTQMQTTLLEILASNPSIVFKVLNITAPNSTFKIVLTSFTNNKIGLIKMFREIAGAGLADAKNWSEGNTYHGLPSGTFKKGMTREEADNLAAVWNERATNGYASNGYQSSATGLKVKVISDTEQHNYRELVSWAVDKQGELYP
jgi:ribosomal protein L7/L12